MMAETIEDSQRQTSKPVATVVEDQPSQEAEQVSKSTIRMIWMHQPIFGESTLSEKKRRKRRNRRSEKTVPSKRRRRRLEGGLKKEG